MNGAPSVQSASDRDLRPLTRARSAAGATAQQKNSELRSISSARILELQDKPSTQPESIDLNSANITSSRIFCSQTFSGPRTCAWPSAGNFSITSETFASLDRLSACKSLILRCCVVVQRLLSSGVEARGGQHEKSSFITNVRLFGDFGM
jgi:hypothetical protein